jgi:quercetin dioxygenase-like cupin family protein
MSAVEDFRRLGYLAPVPLFSTAQAAELLKRLRNYPDPPDWRKSLAVHYSAYAELARHPAIVTVLKQLLGEDIILWGASLVRKAPAGDHPWHSDVETAYGGGKTVSVWIALQGVSSKSGLQLVSTSHHFGVSVQELQFSNDVERASLSSEQVLSWAQHYNPRSEIHQPRLHPGDAVFFDGRTWHGSLNHQRVATRTALLLQYATPDEPIRICEAANVSPYLYTDRPGPPCMLISGRDASGVNTLIPGPTSDTKMKPSRRKTFLSTVVKHMDLPLKENPDTGWESYPLSRGITPSVDRMSFHMSVLSPGVTPHDPHSHADEELLIMLDGEADLVMVPENITGKQEHYRLAAGSLVYYPAFYTHTIHNTGSKPITYLMFRWGAPLPSGFESQAATYQFDYPDLSLDNQHEQPFEIRKVFDFPTRHLKKLHCHVSLLQPGASYKAHRDRHDVAILLLKGVVETLDQTVEPFGVVYYSAGEMHGMKNVGDTPAYYLVFEFHAGPSRSKWLRTGLQVRRILKSPLQQIPRNLGVFMALNFGVAMKIWKRHPTSRARQTN